MTRPAVASRVGRRHQCGDEPHLRRPDVAEDPEHPVVGFLPLPCAPEMELVLRLLVEAERHVPPGASERPSLTRQPGVVITTRDLAPRDRSIAAGHAREPRLEQPLAPVNDPRREGVVGLDVPTEAVMHQTKPPTDLPLELPHGGLAVLAAHPRRQGAEANTVRGERRIGDREPRERHRRTGDGCTLQERSPAERTRHGRAMQWRMAVVAVLVVAHRPPFRRTRRRTAPGPASLPAISARARAF